MRISGVEGVAGGISLIPELDNEPTRVLKTLKIFDNVRFFGGAGEIRPESDIVVSLLVEGVVILSVRENERCSKDEEPFSTSEEFSKFELNMTFCRSLLNSSCRKRCRCLAIHTCKRGDSIAT